MRFSTIHADESGEIRMSGLLIGGVAIAWACLGLAVWAMGSRRLLHKPGIAGGAAFLAVWIAAPVADDVLTQIDFHNQCAELVPEKFTGPVVVGPGTFFTREGNPTWSPIAGLQTSREPYKSAWANVFDQRESWVTTSTFPAPIRMRIQELIERSSGRIVDRKADLYGTGGWIRRAIGWDEDASMQCIGARITVFKKTDMTTAGGGLNSEDFIAFQ